MSNELNVTYCQSVRRQDNAMVKPLAWIIDEIQSDRHGDLVKDIRAIEDKDRRKILKEQLPIFRPALVDKLPTGIVSFDIDKKDNVGLESAVFKDCLEKIPSCIYAFESPSGGMKFGILTDFKDNGIDKGTTSDRYRMAYASTLEYVKGQIAMEILADSTSQSIHQLCYLSCDPNAYFNPVCETLKVNHECIVEPPVQRSVNQDYSDDFVLELLEYIPRDFGYGERLTINYAVLKQLGESAISLLVAHWDKEDKHELECKIRDQLQNLQYGSIGHLIKVAKANGYVGTTGRARKHLKPEPIQHQAYPLVSLEEGTTKMTAIVRSYFQGNRNVFLNVSTGAGKSHAVLDILVKEIPRDKKTLILVPSHDLGKELMNKFNSLRKTHIETKATGGDISDTEDNTKSACPDLMRLKFRNSLSNIVHLRGQQGKDGLCEMKNNHFHKAGRNVPWQVCARCPMAQGCRYLDQFDGLFDNIRIMTHNEWMNMESNWFAGHRSGDNGYPQPRKGKGWKPDYIIIDENIFNVSIDEMTSDRGDKFPSIKQIIEDVVQGVPISDAVICNRKELIEDAEINIRPDYPRSNLSDSAYEAAFYQYKKMMREFSTVLEKLALYATTNEDRHLLGIWVEDGAIYHAPISQPEDRYKNVPTLFLDATANEDVVRRFVPDIDFHRIPIRSNPEVKLYQLADTSVTKNKLGKPEYRENMIDWLKKIIANRGYSNVGLITYKEIDGIKGQFDEYLAHAIGAKIFNHFGAIRGVNTFENIDCLLIVGRQFIGTDAVKNMASAVFGEALKYEDAYVDKPVRMIDGSFASINCRAAVNDSHNAINQHYSVGETIQAIGRARSIHGTPKDVYYFSNEGLGLDVEVTDFFYQDAPASHVVPTEAIKEIIKTGYVQDKPSELINIGIPGNIVKNQREKIIDELAVLGIYHLKFNVIDNKNRLRQVSYFVENIDLFKIGNRIDNKTIKSPVESELIASEQ